MHHLMAAAVPTDAPPSGSLGAALAGACLVILVGVVRAIRANYLGDRRQFNVGLAIAALGFIAWLVLLILAN